MNGARWPFWACLGCVFAVAASGCTQRDAKNTPPEHAQPGPLLSEPRSPASATQASPTKAAETTAPEDGSAPQATAEPQAPVAVALPSVRSRNAHCRILAIGDSLTDPRSHGGGFLSPWLEKCPRCQVTNIAKGGAMVNQMLSQVKHHLGETSESYSHFIVFGGVNDLYSDKTAKRTLSKIERDLTAIYALGHANHAAVVAVGVAPWGGFRKWFTEERGANMAQLNEWIRQQKAAGIVDVFVDSVTELTCGNARELCPELAKPFHDGLHFGPAGHRKLGVAIVDALGGAACGE